LIGHNQTFISVGSFDTENEAVSLIKYIKTKFFRAMLGIMKTTQNNQAAETWTKIPLFDFSRIDVIDWRKTISEIDQQLYKHYDLSQEEINFIEEKVKAME
ncbi:MAG: type II restriction endonuclease subunit R, partial [Helcococcus sp.]|nr:type II restriction endonuclease subunit R [Helcococcus sp.]